MGFLDDWKERRRRTRQIERIAREPNEAIANLEDAAAWLDRRVDQLTARLDSHEIDHETPTVDGRLDDLEEKVAALASKLSRLRYELREHDHEGDVSPEHPAPPTGDRTRRSGPDRWPPPPRRQSPWPPPEPPDASDDPAGPSA